jgi:DNA-binding NtrC family response regulator
LIKNSHIFKLYVMVSVLLVDTDKELHTSLKAVMPEEFKFLSAYTVQKALLLLQTEAPEVVLLTDTIGEPHCFEVLQSIVNSPFSPPVIMISQDDNFSFIINSIKKGAHDYLKKPINIKTLKISIIKALQNYAGIRNTFHTERTIPELAGLIGGSDKIRKLKRIIHKYAASPYPVLIRGESGTGKELIATAIHALSPRKDGPFLAKNCGAIPPTLIQSELFGSEKGAYTDASSKPGSFELANRGSLFLDEIGEMDILAQVHLLRVLESREVVRLGGLKTIPVDVRIITATNKDLQDAIRNKDFREDLYYRINTLILKVPPLRERKSDIPLLARHFVCTAGKTHTIFSAGSMQKLMDHGWPGNVRELKAAVQRSLLHAESNIIEPKDIILNQ